MEISSRFVGWRSAPYTVELDPRKTMNFAAGIFDPNPRYFDDEREGCVIAHPMLALALTWRVAYRFHDYWKIPGFPHEALARQVHSTEHIEWGAPMRPGDTITVVGEIAALLPHAAGALLVVRFDATNQHGQTVYTEYEGGLLRDVKLIDSASGKEALPVPSRAKARAGMAWEKTIAVHPLAAHIYDACADVGFPIHTSRKFARSVGLPGAILHGAATLAYAVREMVDAEAESDPARLRSLSCQFTGMVLPGSDITVRVTAIEPEGDRKNVFFEVLNSSGKKAVRNGHIRFTA